MAAIIKIENLYKIYPVGKEKVVALGGINLEIPKGQICCILGTSGSGKSTLLNQLAGLEKPTKGRVLIGGVSECFGLVRGTACKIQAEKCRIHLSVL